MGRSLKTAQGGETGAPDGPGGALGLVLGGRCPGVLTVPPLPPDLRSGDAGSLRPRGPLPPHAPWPQAPHVVRQMPILLLGAGCHPHSLPHLPPRLPGDSSCTLPVGRSRPAATVGSLVPSSTSGPAALQGPPSSGTKTPPADIPSEDLRGPRLVGRGHSHTRPPALLGEPPPEHQLSPHTLPSSRWVSLQASQVALSPRRVRGRDLSGLAGPAVHTRPGQLWPEAHLGVSSRDPGNTGQDPISSVGSSRQVCAPPGGPLGLVALGCGADLGIAGPPGLLGLSPRSA